MIPQAETPVHLADARRVIGDLIEILRPFCERIEIAGSVRRGKPEVKDAEVVIIPTPYLHQQTDVLIETRMAQYALYGEKRQKRWGNSYRGLLYKGIKCELFMTTWQSWGYQYWLRTGPGDANKYIMQWLGLPHVTAPVRFQEGYGWFSSHWSYDGKKWVAPDRQRLRIASEEDLFKVLGMPFIPPNERTEMVYKRLTNKRDYKWPETYEPFFAKADEQMELIERIPVAHFFEDKDLDEKALERETRWAAEWEYHRWLTSDRALTWEGWKLKYPKARGEVEQKQDQNNLLEN